MNPQERLLELAASTPSPTDFEAAALSLSREMLDADVAALVSLARPRQRNLLGFGEIAARLDAHWDGYGAEVRPVQHEAQRAGVASDLGTLGRALWGTRIYRDVMAPLGGTESLFAMPSFRGRTVGMLMVGLRGGRFSEAGRRRLSAFGVSLGVAWVASMAGAEAYEKPKPEVALTEAERDLLAYLELGYTTREIAAGRATSYYTVRNQLSTLYRKLGVTNRTEAVGLRQRR
ncbi:MAG: LuxR C-terminal-related transcriptional regulator [Myxococcota bacterium]